MNWKECNRKDRGLLCGNIITFGRIYRGPRFDFRQW